MTILGIAIVPLGGEGAPCSQSWLRFCTESSAGGRKVKPEHCYDHINSHQPNEYGDVEVNTTNALATLTKITQAIRASFSEPEPPPMSATTLLRSSGMIEDEGYYIGCQAQVREVVHLKRMYSYLLDHPRGGDLVANSFASMILHLENLAPVFLIRAAKLLERSGWIWQGEPIDSTVCIPLPNIEDRASRVQDAELALSLSDETEAPDSVIANYLENLVPLPNIEDRASRTQFFFNIVGIALPLPDETEALKREFAKYLENLDTPEPSQSQDSKQRRIGLRVILLFAYLLVSTAWIPLLIYLGWQNVTMGRTFDREVTSHLQRAIDASTVEVAKKEISTAVNVIENHDHFNQQASFEFPNWFRNLKTLQANLGQVSTTAPTSDQAIALKHVKWALRSHRDSSRTAVNIPKDFEYNNAFYILFTTGLIIVVGTCLVMLEKEGYHLWYDLRELLRHLRFPKTSPPSESDHSS